MKILKTLGNAQDNDNFTRATFLALQPHDVNGITDRWTNYIEKADEPGQYGVYLVDGESYPVRSDVEPHLFSGYLAKYIEAGILTDGCINQAAAIVGDAAGGFLDIGGAIERVFTDNGGADEILTLEQAQMDGWF